MMTLHWFGSLLLFLRFLDHEALTLASGMLRGAGDHLRGKSLSLALNDA